MHSFVCAFFLGVPPPTLPMVGQAGSGYTLLCASWGRRIPLLSLTREGINPLDTWLDFASLLCYSHCLCYIQYLPGHESSKTSEIYTHITRIGSERVQSPFDRLNG